ncbi:cytochrome P450 [Mycena leptocephala]|nr:cytochrome P450 [Mycena leptocephala]
MAGLATLVCYHLVKARHQNLPPGPLSFPICGNFFQIPAKEEWLTFTSWANMFGDCVHLNMFGQSLVVLNSFEAANELLNFRSSLYSDRPQLIMAGDLIGFDRMLGLIPYGSVFRKLRRLVHKELGNSAAQAYQPYQEHASRNLIHDLILREGLDIDLLRHYSGSVILKVAYGYQTERHADPFLSLCKQVMEGFSLASQPGAWVVDMLPWLRSLPEWFPGVKFHRAARRWRTMLDTVVGAPFEWAEAHQDLPSLSKPNFLTSAFAKAEGRMVGEQRELHLFAAGSLFGGGADTTAATLSWFFLAMALHPVIQKRAQEEIDLVVGRDRLPELLDRPRLPYLESVLLELFRWNPVGPLGLPHRLILEDHYRGFRIPQGSIVVGNAWAMLHDPLIYSDPHKFNPDRFINNAEAAGRVNNVAFGFGRRACPGVHLAKSTVFMAMLTALATCEIGPAVDLHGEPMVGGLSNPTGSINHPRPFHCRISPRLQASLLDPYA